MGSKSWIEVSDRKDVVGSKSVLRDFFLGHVEMPIRNSNGVVE